jgi:DNA (cytosine-5)-methyltransferase 1
VIVDLYAGAGGWDLAARDLGLDVIGVEWMPEACATREAAGLRTVKADVAALDPFFTGPLTGLIASPPCQAFSTAGKQLGRSDLSAIGELIIAAASDPVYCAVREQWLDLIHCAPLAARRKAASEWDHAFWADERSALVVEPLRWASIHRESLEWIALEQVPPVLPLWEGFAVYFREWGFDVWAGLLNAADYGVPQTRTRAILMASKTRKVGRPPATHADPRRTLPMFVKPWVSMAEALGWGYDERGSATVTAGGGNRRTGALQFNVTTQFAGVDTPCEPAVIA